ncbi:MAG: thioredoxin family protein [Methanosarcinales archaeon]
MKPIKIITLLAIVIIIGFMYVSVQSSPVLSDEKYSYLGGLTWNKNIDEGFRIAQEQNKPILVYFWAQWCKYCEQLETKTLPNEKVSKILKNDFVLVAIDLDEQGEVAQRYGVSYPPHEIFLDKNGNIITRIPGYVDANRFLMELKEVKKGVKV